MPIHFPGFPTPPVTVDHVIILDANTIRVVFSAAVKTDSAFYIPSKYVVESRTGGTPLYVKSVVPDPAATTTTSFVDLVFRDFILRRGSYRLWLDGLVDAFDRVVSNTPFQFSDSSAFWPFGAMDPWTPRRLFTSGISTDRYYPTPTNTTLEDLTHVSFVVSSMIGYLLVDSDGSVFSVVDNDAHTITVFHPTDTPALGAYSVLETPFGASLLYWQLKSYMFKWMNISAESSIGALLYTISKFNFRFGGTEGSTGGVQAVRDGITLFTAEGVDLNIIGQNYGVSKSIDPRWTDSIFRSYIQAMAYKPKLIRSRIEEILTILVGDKATIGWGVYEPRPNTIVVDMGRTAFPVDPAFATFLNAAGASPAFATGDYLVNNTFSLFNPFKIYPKESIVTYASLRYQAVASFKASTLQYTQIQGDTIITVYPADVVLWPIEGWVLVYDEEHWYTDVNYTTGAVTLSVGLEKQQHSGKSVLVINKQHSLFDTVWWLPTTLTGMETPGSVDQIAGVPVPIPILHNGVFLTNASVVPFLDDALKLVRAAGVHVEIYVNQGG